MSKVRVPVANTPSKVVTIESDATIGATFGVNLRYPNGTLVQLTDFGNSTPPGQNTIASTIWRLIFEIPPNVTALANTATTGLYVITGPGTSATRGILPGPGISVTFSNGVAGDPTIAHGDTSSVTDISATFSGSTVLGEISLTFDTFGHVLTRTITGRQLDHNELNDIQGGSVGERYHFTAAQHAGLIPWSSVMPADYALITQTITNGDTTHAPSGDTVFDALAAIPRLLTGTYAARPSASAANSGFTYYATDVRETSMSDGSAWAIVEGGGNELGYAESTVPFTTSSLVLVDVPGMSVTFTAGERPVSINFGSTMRNQLAGEFTRLALILDGSPVAQLLTQNTQYYGLSRQFRASGFAPGTTHTAKLQALTTAAFGPGVAEIFGDPVDRTYLQVVNC